MTRTLFALVLLAHTQASFVLGDEASTISVAGLGEITVEPDSVCIELAVTFTGNDLRVAKQEVDNVMAALLEVTKRMKVADDDVSATVLQMDPKWDYEKERNIGFEVSRSMSVKLRQVVQLDEFLNASIEVGANRIDRIVLETSKEAALKDKALMLAISNAEQQARKIATGLGAKLGKVHKVTGNEEPYVTLLTSTVNGLSGESYKPAKIKVSVGIGVIYLLE